MPWIGLSMLKGSREFRHKNGEIALIKYTPTVYVDNVEAAYTLAKHQVGILLLLAISAKRILSEMKYSWFS
jgi:hypothetical protein